MATIFKRIIQPTNWTCGPTVAAMITCKDVDYVLNFIGHDGSEYDETGPEIDGKKVKSFYMQEILIYLISEGWSFGAPIRDIHNKWDEWKRTPAIVRVSSERYEGRSHLILWTSEEVLDPSPKSSDDRNLEEYDIIDWYPLMFWGKYHFEKYFKSTD